MRRQRQTMAEMVDELRSQSPDAVALGARGSGREGGGLVSPGGVVFIRMDNDLSPAQALVALKAGALVAWDACGCGGYCGFDWLDEDRCEVLTRAERPRIGGKSKKGRWGTMSLWRSVSGMELLVAEGYVRWGAELA